MGSSSVCSSLRGTPTAARRAAPGLWGLFGGERPKPAPYLPRPERSPQPCCWGVLMSLHILRGCSLETCPQPKLMHPQSPWVHSVPTVWKEEDWQLLSKLSTLVRCWRAAQPHSPACSTFRHSGEAQESTKGTASLSVPVLGAWLQSSGPRSHEHPCPHAPPAPSERTGEATPACSGASHARY